MQRFTLLFLLVFFLAIQSFSSQIIVSGNVSGNWNTDTVLVTANIHIADGDVLTISAGTLVQFQGYYRFRIDGQLLALGSETDSILFTINDTTGFSNIKKGTGGWSGLWFENVGAANDSSLFGYCRFEYSKAIFDPDSTFWYGGAVCARDFSKVRFSNSMFYFNAAYKNGGAIYARQADIQVDQCAFINNFCGQTSLYGYGGGICLEYSDAAITRNYFTLNSSTGVGGGLSFEYSDPRIESNYFYDNYSAIGGALVCLRSAGTKPIVNNLVEANSSYFYGGGIAMLQSSTPLTNNTIVANFSSSGGGLYFNASAFPVIKNCVVWDNYDYGGGGPQVYIWDTFSAPEFYYCVMEGGVEQFGGTGGSGDFIGVYENCFETDPEFTGSGNDPFQPSQTSICIDNGTPDTTGLNLPEVDFAGNNRILNNFVDMGAYETLLVTTTQEAKDEVAAVSVFPSPNNGTFQIQSNQHENLTFQKLTIYNLKGKVVFESENPELLQSEIELPSLPNGIYFTRLAFRERSYAVKFAIQH